MTLANIFEMNHFSLYTWDWVRLLFRLKIRTDLLVLRPIYSLEGNRSNLQLLFLLNRLGNAWSMGQTYH